MTLPITHPLDTQTPSSLSTPGPRDSSYVRHTHCPQIAYSSPIPVLIQELKITITISCVQMILKAGAGDWCLCQGNQSRWSHHLNFFITGHRLSFTSGQYKGISWCLRNHWDSSRPFFSGSFPYTNPHCHSWEGPPWTHCSFWRKNKNLTHQMWQMWLLILRAPKRYPSSHAKISTVFPAGI